MEQPSLAATVDSPPAQERSRFIEHRGVRILLLDYRGIRDPDQALREIEKSKALVAAQPLRSLRVLTNVREARYNGAVLQGMKELARHDEPYVMASAVVGLTGLLRIAYSAVTTFSRRNIAVFGDETEALDWLASQ